MKLYKIKILKLIMNSVPKSSRNFNKSKMQWMNIHKRGHIRLCYLRIHSLRQELLLSEMKVCIIQNLIH